MLKNIVKTVPAPTQEALVKIREEGVAWKEALATVGVSYAQGWLIVARAEAEKAGATFDASAMTEAEIAAEIARLRAEGASWGTIMVVLDITEARARKVWANASGTHSEGTRVGKGGRFLFGEKALYADQLAATGTALSAKERKSRSNYLGTAEAVKMVHLDLPALRALAEEYGVSGKGNKAAIVNRIRRAQAAQASA